MIEFRHLRYFIAVAEELNFRRAAERVHIDQTPLSRTVRDLEERMGVALLVRRPRRLQLTPAGVKLLDHARRLFLRLERIKRAVRETDARYRAPLRIGVADGIAQPKLSECFANWRALAPNIPLDIAEMRAVELLAALRREEIDVGFSFGVPDDEAVVQEVAWSYPLVALLPPGHKLVARDVLPISELLAFPMIASHPGRLPGLREQMDAVRRQYTASPIIAGEARTLAGYITRVASGLGVGVADAGHMETLRRADVVAVPLAEDIRINTYVLHKPQSHELHDALQRFLAHAKTPH
ncbi:LysR family transcriptional regulator [Variovorax boronicumulans]|uniref:LysR family transcriptional regulator n=1 Tax=Variovorax boronicumulans TaxID=436515 RepID=UPI0012E633EA|nr:LysR substrate-binding domain-containing protein [Variovorax boronicumulans]GER09527.1 LysR family transcriptional regulator [Variovorax boronicumulans]